MTASGPVSRTIRWAHVQAAERPNGVFHGGPVLSDDPDSLKLRHNRAGQAVDHFAPAVRDPVTLAGSYAYLGRSFGHFGHIMSEMIHRILPTREVAKRPRWLIVHQRGSPAHFGALAPAAQAMLRLLGVNEDNCTVLAEDALVEELLIVEAGTELGSAPKDWYLDLLNRRGPGTRPLDGDFPKKVYVSRGGLEDKSGLLGEKVLEAMLSDAGFHIMHSEKLPLLRQFAMYRAAEVLLFAEGSACHGVELFGGDTLPHTVLMNRRPKAATAFDRVLAPRSERFDHFTGNPFFGTAVFNGRGDPRADRGVSAIALHDLSAFLDELGVARGSRVPALAYLAAAYADLKLYTERATALTRRVQPELLPRQLELVERLEDLFTASIQAGGRIGPVPRGQALA